MDLEDYFAHIEFEQINYSVRERLIYYAIALFSCCSKAGALG
ncbi:hypothetical protein COO91_01734 [Nostoc flagelliforme CCNUN1]|uniref:Uncharacterized protein n=1 Tax=Nostoc flagelliforme CCNUN1 TaxID=2038116 RepID=A0A2K8SK80_9NOSO|nr:hypothetical protein COO91_01734 [Nostoc flagelliforme CCNUN1]